MASLTNVCRRKTAKRAISLTVCPGPLPRLKRWRMSGRRVCEKCGASYHVVAIPPKVEGVCDACGGTLVQRADDAPKTVASRLEVYHRETEPLKEYYAKKGNLKEIFNQATVEGTTQKILEALGQNV